MSENKKTKPFDAEAFVQQELAKTPAVPTFVSTAETEQAEETVARLLGQGPTADPTPPKIGETRGSFMFRGGDPSEEDNWEPVRQPGKTESPWKVQKEPEGFDEILGTSVMPRSEVEAVAKMRGVDPETLYSMSHLFGARTEEKDQDWQSILNRAAGFGIPEYVMKKSIDDPKMRTAIDDIRRIADNRRSWLQTVGEATATGGLAGVGRSVLKKAVGRETAETAAKIGAADTAEAMALGATGGVGFSREGEEEEMALYGALFGLGGTGVAKFLGRTGSSPKTPKTVDDIPKADRSIKNIPNLADDIEVQTRQNLQKDLPELEEALIKETTERTRPEQTRITEFARYLSGEEELTTSQANKIVRELAREGDDFATREMQRYMEFRATRDVLTEKAIIAPPDMNDTWRSVRFFLSDARYPYRELEETHPDLRLDLEPIVDKMSNAYDKMTVDIAGSNQRYSDLVVRMRKEGVSPQDMFMSLDTGKPVGKVTPSMLSDWQTEFETLRELANSRAGSEIIKKTDNYVRHIPVTPERATNKILARAREFGAEPNAKIPEVDWARIQDSDEGQELLDMLKFTTKRVPESPAELIQTLREVRNPKNVRETYMSRAGTLHERVGEIPAPLLETDVRRAYQNWINTTFRHVHLRDSLAQLRHAATKLEVAGDTRGAEYVRDHISYLNGTNKGWYTKQLVDSTIRDWKLYTGRKAEETGNSLWETAEAIPDMLSKTQSVMYANYLSTVKAPVRNLFQPMVLTMPELAGKSPLQAGWATRKVAKAYPKVMADWKGTLAELKARGHLPDRFVGEGLDHVQRGMLDNVALRKAGVAVEKAGNVMLYFYQLSDTINRAVTLHAAKEVASSMMEGNKYALRYLENLGPGYKAKLQKALREGNAEQVEDLVVDQLLSSTQFRYNGTALSKYGREMGPMFSVFMKWPASVGGDIVSRLHRKGMIEGGTEVMAKYLSPVLLLALGDAAINQNSLPEYIQDRLPDETDLSEARNDQVRGTMTMIGGGGGFRGYAPLFSIKNALHGDVAPPIIQLGTNVYGSFEQALAQGDMGELIDLLSEATYQRVPFAGAVRFVADDLTTIWTGERPGGKSFFEKVERAAPEIRREFYKKPRRYILRQLNKNEGEE